MFSVYICWIVLSCINEYMCFPVGIYILQFKNPNIQNLTIFTLCISNIIVRKSTMKALYYAAK